MTSQQQRDQSGRNVEQFGSRSISKDAAEWLLRWHANNLTPAQRQENLQWLQESPQHVAETLRMLRLYGWLRKHRSVFDLEGFQSERDRLDHAWAAIRNARDRDLVLWAEDSVPAAKRIKQAVGMALPLPETTLKLMATYERERRSTRKERLWWIAGIVLTGILAPTIAAYIGRLLSAIGAGSL